MAKASPSFPRTASFSHPHHSRTLRSSQAVQLGYGYGGGGGDGFYGGGGGSGFSSGGGGGSGYVRGDCLPGSVTLAGNMRFPASTALDDPDYPGWCIVGVIQGV